MSNGMVGKGSVKFGPTGVLYLMVAMLVVAVVVMHIRRNGKTPRTMPPPVIVNNLPIKVVWNFGSHGLGTLPSIVVPTSNGDIYAMTTTGGKYGSGILCRFTSNGQRSVIMNMPKRTMASMPPSLIAGPSGWLYGTMTCISTLPIAELIALNCKTGTITVLKKFVPPKMLRRPLRHMMYGVPGAFAISLKILGLHQNALYISENVPFGIQPPRILRYSLNSHKLSTFCTFTVRRSSIVPGSGCTSLIFGPNGRIYGARETGIGTPSGDIDPGDIFTSTARGRIKVVHRFSALKFFMRNDDGANPVQLAAANNGDVYGITARGGQGGNGVLFVLAPGGKFTVLHDFSMTSTGMNLSGLHPANIAIAPDGVLYGAATLGGTHEHGAIFRYIPGKRSFEVIHEFGQPSSGGSQQDGAEPVALGFGSNGNLLGVTEFGGDLGSGTLFEVDLHHKS